MYIEFVSKRLKEQIEDAKAMNKRYGEDRAREIWKRLDQIRAFNNIGDRLNRVLAMWKC